MEATNIQSLTETQKTENSDYLLFFAENEYKELLSKKSVAPSLSSFYLPKSKTNFFSEIEAFMLSARTAYNSLTSFAATFATKEYSDGKYGTRQRIENKIPSFLDTDTKDSIIAKYVSRDKVEAAGAQAREAAHQYADEMTDFAAAAMVGVRMGDGTEVSSTETGD